MIGLFCRLFGSYLGCGPESGRNMWPTMTIPTANLRDAQIQRKGREALTGGSYKEVSLRLEFSWELLACSTFGVRGTITAS